MIEADPREPSEEGSGDLEPQSEPIEGEIVEPSDGGRVSVSSSFQGPLPPPNILQGYDDVVPGLASKIVAQWEAETAHRHSTVDYANETDRLTVEKHFDAEKRGQYIGLAGLAMVIAVAVLAILLDEPEVGGGALILVGAPSIVWALRKFSKSPDPPPPTDLSNPEGGPAEGPTQTP